ncbi:hsp10-like protein [Russula vinacea]|nr:hsp10-like protein [Russula vinacea]
MAAAAQATFKSIRSLVPLLDRVLVQRFKPETVQNGNGNIPPDFGHVESAPGATVIAVGPGAPNKEGHVVPTSEYFLFKDAEILAKIEE